MFTEVGNRLSDLWVTQKSPVSSWGPQAQGPRLLAGMEAQLVAVRSRTNEKAASMPGKPLPPTRPGARFPAPAPSLGVAPSHLPVPGASQPCRSPSLLPLTLRSPSLACWPLRALHGLLTGCDHRFQLARRPRPRSARPDAGPRGGLGRSGSERRAGQRLSEAAVTGTPLSCH